MKKFNYLLAICALAGVTFITSCGGDDEPAEKPTITVTESGNTGWRGDTITYTVTVSTNGDLENLDITTDPYSATLAFDTTFPKNTHSATVTYNYIIPGSAIDGQTHTITFKITDDVESATATKTITIADNSGTPFANTENGYFYHIAGSLHGAYDLDGDATVAANGTASAKSMKNTDAAGVTFTGEWESDAANGTQFVKANSYDYANATVETATSTYAGGSASTSVTAPAVNDIYIAKKGSTYYVIKITALDPTDNTCNCNNKGKISFEYKKN